MVRPETGGMLSENEELPSVSDSEDEESKKQCFYSQKCTFYTFDFQSQNSIPIWYNVPQSIFAGVPAAVVFFLS